MKTAGEIKRTFKRIFWIITAAYIFSLFFGFHVYKIYDGNVIEACNGAFEHMKIAPLDIFPLSLAPVKMVTYIFVIALLLLFAEYSRRKQLRPGVEHGSASWNENMKQYNKKYSYPKNEPTADESASPEFLEAEGVENWEPNRNMILTDTVFLNMDTRTTLLNNNIMGVGGSGSGKTRFLIKPNILQANCSYVITDPSGEILEATGEFLKKQGYEIKVFNLVQMEHSCSYNPFAYIRNEEGVLTMITALIKNTTPPNAMQSDPFWEKAEIALLQALCFYLYYECNIEDRSFSSVMRLLRCAEVRDGQADYVSTLDIMFNDLKDKNPEHIAVRQYAVFKQAAGKTAQSILVSCAVRLTIFNMRSIENLTSVDNIDLASIGDKPTALFCITPIVDTTFNFLIAMMYTQLFETLYFHAENQCKGKRLPVHVRFLLDEFANIGTIPDFEQKLSTMRKYEISCTIVLQNLAQIKTMYKDSWETITGNCDTFVFLGGQEESTLKYISEKLGKETIKTQNSSRNYGRQGGSSQSYNAAGRELMTPDEISKMSTAECIVFIRTTLPFKNKKYNYPRHVNYKYTGDASDDMIFDVTDKIHTQDVRSLNISVMNEDLEALYVELEENEIESLENRNKNVRTKTTIGNDIGVPCVITEERIKELNLTEDTVNDLIKLESAFAPFDEYELEDIET
ncbi:MAG: type IV secretory system conjugative DNA transfer family protein [Oscillospiraceae bacterium]|nr:type IV secretory system conjugative DNA transfer family protein [Oscillospiraceae bacterium]